MIILVLPTLVARIALVYPAAAAEDGEADEGLAYSENGIGDSAGLRATYAGPPAAHV